MTPKPPSSSDGSSIPPRHRPHLGNLAKDTTEIDLWAFDDLEPLEDLAGEETEKQVNPGIPTSRDTGGKKGDEGNAGRDDQAPLAEVPKAAAAGSESVTVNVSQKNKADRSAKSRRGPNPHSTPGKDFDELETWEDIAEVFPEDVPEPVAPNAFKEISPTPEPAADGPAVIPLSEPGDDRDEFSPKPRADIQPVSIRPELNLSKIEKIGLIALIVLLVTGGGVFYFNTIRQIPGGAVRAGEADFPIQGDKLGVVSAVTFWREPITSGENADTVRRDALLIPVVDLKTSGGPAAIRIFFRDSNRELVGDAVSRTIRGEEKFQVAATAGFDDLGKHAAYRTGQDKPWTIEVLEGPSENSPTEEFKRLFEMNISSDRRSSDRR